MHCYQDKSQIGVSNTNPIMCMSTRKDNWEPSELSFRLRWQVKKIAAMRNGIQELQRISTPQTSLHSATTRQATLQNYEIITTTCIIYKDLSKLKLPEG